MNMHISKKLTMSVCVCLCVCLNCQCDGAEPKKVCNKTKNCAIWQGFSTTLHAFHKRLSSNTLQNTTTQAEVEGIDFLCFDTPSLSNTLQHITAHCRTLQHIAAQAKVRSIVLFCFDTRHVFNHVESRMTKIRHNFP